MKNSNLAKSVVFNRQGLGHSFLYIPIISEYARSKGYAPICVYNNNRKICDANVTSLTYDPDSNVDIVFFDRVINTNENIQLLCTYTKNIKIIS